VASASERPPDPLDIDLAVRSPYPLGCGTSASGNPLEIGIDDGLLDE